MSVAFSFRRLSALPAIFLVAALLLTIGRANADPPGTAPFFLHDGDSPIVFIGDSITEQNAYTTFIEAYVLTRFPHWNVTFRNLAWGSDTSWMVQRGGLDNGLARDVLPLHPAAALIDYGMNDARGGDATYPLYLDSSTKLTQALQLAGTRVALLSPSPEELYQPGQPGGSAYNLELQKYTAGLQGVAAARGVPFVDQLTPFIAAINSGRQAGVLGATGEPRLSLDGVHPDLDGHVVMADAILKGLNAPALVSRVVLDAGAHQVVAAENCRVSSATFGSGATFTRDDDALPWVLPPEASLALRLPGFDPYNDLSHYDLQVTNLPPGRYSIAIDNRTIGAYDSTELEAGLNLSSHAGPITDQAVGLLTKIVLKNNTFYDRWRNVQLAVFPPWLEGPDTEAHRQAELARLDAQIAAQESEINALRQPVSHTWRITPIAPIAPAVTSPANNSILLAPPVQATGTLGALVGDTALRASVALYRYGDATTPPGFWNGTSWLPRATGSLAEMPALVAGDLWSCRLPTSSQGMVPGHYAVRVVVAYARHGARPSPWAAFTIVAPDVTRPVIAFTRPSNVLSRAALLNSLAPLGGTVVDNPGGSGVDRVQMELLRASDRKWWTGTSWGARTLLPATLGSDGTWTKLDGLPEGADLADGIYSLNALATDKAGNRSRVTALLQLDTHAPTITLSGPRSDVPVVTLKPIRGTALDDVGLANVQITIQRDSDGLFWTGTAWGERTLLDTTLGTPSGGAIPWSRLPNYPLGVNLQSGFYDIQAIATDLAGNQGQSSKRVQVNTSLPSIIISTPANRTVFTPAGLGTVSGRALDNAGGEGVARVQITIQRDSDGLFWTGIAWGTATALATTLGADGNWSKNFGLPSGFDLTNGRYLLVAAATDKAGNSTSANSTFFVVDK